MNNKDNKDVKKTFTFSNREELNKQVKKYLPKKQPEPEKPFKPYPPGVTISGGPKPPTTWKYPKKTEYCSFRCKKHCSKY